MLLLTNFVNGLIITVAESRLVFGTSLIFIEHCHVTSNGGVRVIGKTVESLYIGAEWTRVGHTSIEYATTSLGKLILIECVRLFVELMNPSCYILIVLQCGLTKVSTLISYHRYFLWICLF